MLGSTRLDANAQHPEPQGAHPMTNAEMTAFRQTHNTLMTETDAFFQEFGALDDKAYAAGAISKKHKELMGLSISVATRCNECIHYHINGCLSAGASKDELVEAIKIGVVGGGSITYPNARFAFALMKELHIIQQ